MRGNRQLVLSEILHTEAGYAERPEEGGGAVNMGITFSVFSAWRKLKGHPEVTWEDLRNMERDEAVAIYDEQFLKPIHFDELPDGVDYAVLDAAVNGGVAGAIKLLQSALGHSPVDGQIGLRTLWAVKHRKVDQLIADICAFRLAKYKTFPRWNRIANAKTGKTWGQIWSARIAYVQKKSITLSEDNRDDCPA